MADSYSVLDEYNKKNPVTTAAPIVPVQKSNTLSSLGSSVLDSIKNTAMQGLGLIASPAYIAKDLVTGFAKNEYNDYKEASDPKNPMLQRIAADATMVVNPFTLGLLQPVGDLINDTIAQKSLELKRKLALEQRPAKWTDYAGAIGSGALDAGLDFLGKENFKAGMTGQRVIGANPDGSPKYQQLSQFERGIEDGKGVFSVYGALGLGSEINGLRGGRRAGGPAKPIERPADFKDITTIGQVAAEKAKRDGKPFEDVLANITSGKPVVKASANPTVNPTPTVNLVEHPTSTVVTPKEPAGPKPAEPLPGEVPIPEPGMTRMYHGGIGPIDGPRWFTSDQRYAQGYADKSGAPVHYIDIPTDHPLIEPDYPEQSIEKGFHQSAELPAEIATQAKQLPSTPAITPQTLIRIDNADADLTQQKPHGLYTTIGENSPHEDYGDTRYSFDATGQNTLTTTPADIAHDRFGSIEYGPASSGVNALRALTSPEEFEQLRTMSKPDLIDLLNKQHPGPDYTQYHDSYELLETLGAQRARAAGYDSIVQHDSVDPQFSEYVALHPDAVKLTGSRPVGESAAPNSSIPETPAPPVISTTPDPKTGESPAQKFATQEGVKGLMSNPDHARLITEVVQSEAGKKILADMAAGKLPDVKMHEAIMDQVRAGNVSPETIQHLIENYDLSPDDVSNQIADMVDKTSSFSGHTLKDLADPVRAAYEEAAAREAAGDPTALADRQLMDAARARQLKPFTWLDKSLTWWKSMVIGNLSTTLRIARTEAEVGVNQLFGHMVSGTVEAMVGKSREAMGMTPNRPLSHYYSSLLSDLGAMADIYRNTVGERLGGEAQPRTKLRTWLSGGTTFPYEQVINNDVLNRIVFKRGSEVDLAAETIQNRLLSADPSFPVQAMDKIANVLTAGHRATTWLGRHFFFDARFRDNLEALGVKPEEFIERMKHPDGLPKEWSDALMDAYGHAMKQTYQYVPKEGITKSILDVYKNKYLGPILTLLVDPFPRFAMNTFRWQMEHSPAGITSLLNPEFRAQLAQGGLPGRMAARKIGDAVTGMMTLGAAFNIRNSGLGGPKYYQVYQGDNKDGHPEFLDVRSHLPLASYLFAASWLSHAAHGAPMNLTQAEWQEGVFAGAKVFANSPLAMIPALFQDADSTKDEGTFWTKAGKALGDFAAGSFRLPHELEKIYGIFRPEEAQRRDMKGGGAVGAVVNPVLASIPGAMETLPAQMNVYRGAPRTIEHPGLSFLGENVESMTKLQRTLATFPGFTDTALIGNHGTPEANELVAKYMGKMFMMSAGDDTKTTLGDAIANEINHSNSPADAKMHALHKVIDEIRDSAVKAAMLENRQPFLKGYEEKNYLPSQLKAVSEKLVPGPGPR